ncbi:MAG: hypothetical protein QM813_24330 [Verrucomicrobiota bacterium]
MTKARLAVALGTLILGVALRPACAHPTNATDPVYLFSTFKEGAQDGLRFAFSYDGYNWTTFPGSS